MIVKNYENRCNIRLSRATEMKKIILNNYKFRPMNFFSTYTNNDGENQKKKIFWLITRVKFRKKISILNQINWPFTICMRIQISKRMKAKKKILFIILFFS